MKYLSIFILCLTFSFCTKSEQATPKTITGTIEGEWHLSNVSGGLQGLGLDYELEEVVWTFSVDSTLTVKNNIITQGPKAIHSGLKTGMYKYEIKEANEQTKLIIDGIESEPFVVTVDSLYWDQRMVDGFRTVMIRK